VLKGLSPVVMDLAIKIYSMKTIKFLFHPYTLVTGFLVIIISGEHLGGFYALYILLGLPHGALHSIIGVIGMLTLIITRQKYKDVKVYAVRYLANIVGVLLLFLSLFCFFYRDKSNYNVGTFYQTVPQIMLTFFSIISLGFIITNLNAAFKIPRKVNLY
jgi:hypothetical protein